MWAPWIRINARSNVWYTSLDDISDVNSRDGEGLSATLGRTALSLSGSLVTNIALAWAPFRHSQ